MSPRSSVRAGDAVDDQRVRRRADRAGEAAVALERRRRALGADEALGGLVELGRRDALADLPLQQPHRAHEDVAGDGHLLDLLRRLADDHRRVFEAQRRDRRPDVVVDLRRGGCRRSGAAARAPRRRRSAAPSAVVDLQALADRLGLVVLALDERRAVDVAEALVLGRVELDVVDAAVLETRRPESRRTISSSGASMSRTAVSERPCSSSDPSSASACGDVRGKPSRRKPSAASAVDRARGSRR